jgi:hypothetical protein
MLFHTQSGGVCGELAVAIWIYIPARLKTSYCTSIRDRIADQVAVAGGAVVPFGSAVA